MSVYNMGLDVGSTTVKLVVLNSSNQVIHSIYKRHFSDVKKTVGDVLLDAYKKFKYDNITIMVTGSGGLGVTKWLDIPFIQEVIASTHGIEKMIPETDVAIELGGEDAKITYLGEALEQRMNSICAGGTGAFIDQMASLLETDAQGLNALAMNHKAIYPIASRCGVFAKTDIQALINQGASKEDIAASVFQAVVNQTISNLACGRPIEGNIAFLGGPLHFMEGLRDRFIKTLELTEDEIINPENSQLYVALGAALSSKDEKVISFLELRNRVINNKYEQSLEIKEMEPLFKDEKEYEDFKERHARDKVEFVEDPKAYKGEAYLGIDAGSTTTKAILLSEDNKILYSFYGNNKGKPIDQALYILGEIYKSLPNIKITYSCVTGYGEDLIKAGLKVDHGEVETMAHYKGARLFRPDVDFILDIGGQDMKAIKIQNGVINEILLNEACSSGCGSFIETFAESVNMSAEDFLNEGLLAQNPVDLGSRCTVFMNSMVKQAQKEGSTLGDISSGLAYSVIKNAIQKVIKARDPKKLGENIVVQGGTFYGDAILRSFEKISGREAIRPNIAGLMGALGAAIIAKEECRGRESTILEKDQVASFEYKSTQSNCGKCGNNCLLTINHFPNNEKYIIGNRCERGAGIKLEKNKLPNLFDYKYKRTFSYKPLKKEEAIRGTVGLPRVLNMYENYPFWHTFFTELGFRVELSKKSSRETYEKGIASIPSETACYPAKMSHGHILNLIEKDVDFIFYPSVFYERQESNSTDNHLNCPVVAGYPEVIKNNIHEIKETNINFKNPFISLDNKKSLKRELYESLKEFDVNKFEVSRAVENAWEELLNYKEDLREKGRETVEYLRENNLQGIVLAGRPYHTDPAINHGIPELITSLGLAVLTEDSVDHLADIEGPLRVLDQWTYHSRLYRAAEYVATNDNLNLIQLVSFGCGLDAVTTDQVDEILEKHDKLYTQLKIDEISNLGAATIRLRSLVSALEERKNKKIEPSKAKEAKIIPFTEEDRKNHTILMPQMAPIQFKMIEKSMNISGYNVEVLGGEDKDIIDTGLKYVHNDACFPAIVVIGQFINALKSGKYDLDNTSILLSQTGGMCRASNYIGFLRKALKESGFENIPVIAVSVQGIEKNPGFKYSISMINNLIMATIIGDLLQRVSLRVRPYEKIKNSTNILLDFWIEKARNSLEGMNKKSFIKIINDIVLAFDKLEVVDEEKPKVGIVGEILVKYHPVANNNLIATLENEGAEVVISDLADFINYSMYNSNFKHDHLGKDYLSKLGGNLGIMYIESYRKHLREALEKSEKFEAPLHIEELAKLGEKVVSLGNQSGEGWLLTAEMMELVEMGVENIVCVQPFGCLPNHITGKGMVKPVREINSKANIIPIDFDPGASSVNQLNRLKLMLSRAEENLKSKDENEVSMTRQELDKNFK